MHLYDQGMLIESSFEEVLVLEVGVWQIPVDLIVRHPGVGAVVEISEAAHRVRHLQFKFFIEILQKTQPCSQPEWLKLSG